jgi:hypothetical protein
MNRSEVLKKLLNTFWFKELRRTPDSELRTGLLTRRLVLKYLLGLPLLSSLPFHLQETRADPPALSTKGRTSIGEFFNGEELFYDGGFWLFKRVAIGKMSFRKLEEEGRYMATLQGETLGVLGWAARYRVDTYRSVMEEVDGGRRLRSISFGEDVKIGSKLRRRTYFSDYQKRRWVRVRRRKDGTEAKTEEEIPPGMLYDDFVTGFYNFRYGVYGKIERGKKYTVPTFPKKGPANYEIWIASKEEEERKRKSLELKEGREYMIKLFIGPEITHSKEGMIEGWLSKDLIPMEGMIRDVILYGDVKAALVKKVRS